MSVTKFRKIMGNSASDVPEVSVHAFDFLCASIAQYGTSRLMIRKGRNNRGEEKVYLIACVNDEYAPVVHMAENMEEVHEITRAVPIDIHPNGPHVVCVEPESSSYPGDEKFEQMRELVKALRVVKPKGYKEGAGREYYDNLLNSPPSTTTDPADLTLIRLAAAMPRDDFNLILELFDVLGVEQAKRAIGKVSLPKESDGEMFYLMKKILDELEQMAPEKVKHGLGTSYLEEAQKALSPDKDQKRLVHMAQTLTRDKLGIVLKMYDVMGIAEANGALSEAPTP